MVGISMNTKALSLVVVCVLVTGCIQQCPDGPFCIHVYDGDSIELDSGEAVRLAGIDAPELSAPGGEAARDYLIWLVHGKQVDLVAGSEERDKYGRLIEYVYVSGICANEEMIRNGYAEVRYLSPDDPKLDYYMTLELEAEHNMAGLWGDKIFQSRSIMEWDENTPVINWKDANKHYGQYVIVEGIIVDTYNSGDVCFLNFHPEWHQYFTAVIFACDFPYFIESPEIYYLGRRVQVIGIIEEYKGSPEIIVKTPDQIMVIG
jgi:endonuclease YncB( thermonuclease family)